MTDGKGIPTPNPLYTYWIRQDQLLLSVIITSLTPTIISFTATAETSKQAWDILATTYGTASRGRIMALKQQLHHLVKGSRSVTEFMHGIRSVVDELSLLGCPTDADDLVIKILNGLDDQYRDISNAIQARESTVSFAELHDKLLSRECQFAARTPAATESAPITAFPASSTQPRSGHSSRGRGRWSRSNSHQSGRDTHSFGQSRGYQGKCQLCGEFGHSARRCPTLPPAQSSNYSQRPAPPVAHTAQQSYSSPSQSDWLLDSGASHHITTDLENLSLHSSYTGYDDVVVGNGEGLKITHIGHLFDASSLTFPDTLCVPHMRKNLISVVKLYRHNDVDVIFSATDFQVKDRHTGATRIRGRLKNDTYCWPHGKSPPTALTTSRCSASLWHSRFGHPSVKVLHHLVSSNKLESSTLSDVACVSCKVHKSHKLPFHESSLMSKAPLQLVFSDVWTSPILSYEGFKYYFIFVDHFFKYIWLFPLKHKSDVLLTFIKFKGLVEKYFSTPIISLFTDNGGEFIVLRPFLTSHGISRLTSPPHTPEHNGFAESRHRHIVETALTLLHHASVPSIHWPYAFATVVYLINRLPKPNLSMQSFYSILFHRAPNLSRLRVFGCQCFPWLRPYTSHKLEPRSRACVFFGYSTTQSAYLCFDPSTSRLLVSHHVEFHENVFPFSLPVGYPAESPPPTLEPVPEPPQINTDRARVRSNPEVCPLDPATCDALPPRDPSPEPTSLPSRLPHHDMQTRSKNNIRKPNTKFGLTVTGLTESEPTVPTKFKAIAEVVEKKLFELQEGMQKMKSDLDLIKTSSGSAVVENEKLQRDNANLQKQVNEACEQIDKARAEGIEQVFLSEEGMRHCEEYYRDRLNQYEKTPKFAKSPVVEHLVLEKAFNWFFLAYARCLE